MARIDVHSAHPRLAGIAMAAACACLAFTLVACSGQGATGSEQAGASSSASAQSAATAGSDGLSSAPGTSSASGASSTMDDVPNKGDITVTETISNDQDGGHAIEADGTEEAYANVAVSKTGDSEGDEADFYGENAAVFATNGATLNLAEVVVESDGAHANGVFSYGEGTTVNIVDSVIETQGNCSGGLMTTGGATMNAENLNISTTGNSSAAIRSDRGGGTVNVRRGAYATSGTGSPVVYSTADITVSDAQMRSTSSQGVVVEGKNSVTLNNVNLVADNNTKNSDKSDFYQAVMIYQSMSGDAANGEASFSMNGGTLTNKNGDVFFVNNTVATIDLSQADIVNEDSDGVFLRAAAAGWGREGSNGGQVTLNADAQAIDGDMVVDGSSNLNLYLSGASSFTGAVNSDGDAGQVYVDLSEGSTWTLTADSHISSLTCEAGSIDLNGHVLYVDGQVYEQGSAQTGEPIEVQVSDQGGGQGGEGMPGEPGDGQGNGGKPGEPPDRKGHGNSDGAPGEPPDGFGGGKGEPPEGAGKSKPA